jgi:hypothetical protein
MSCIIMVNTISELGITLAEQMKHTAKEDQLYEKGNKEWDTREEWRQDGVV